MSRWLAWQKPGANVFPGRPDLRWHNQEWLFRVQTHPLGRDREDDRFRRDPVTRPSQLELAMLPQSCPSRRP